MQRLFNVRFLGAWLTAFVSIYTFNLLWCSGTTFRPLSFPETYLFGILLALMLAMPAVFSHRNYIWFVLVMLADLVFFSNLLYFRTYFNSIPLRSYALAGNLSGFGSSIIASIKLSDFLLFIVTTTGYLLTCKFSKPVKCSVRGYLLALLSVVILAGGVSTIHGGPVNHITGLKKSCHYSTMPPVLYTVFGNLAVEAITQTGKLTPQIYEEVEDWFMERPSYVNGTPLDSADIRNNLVVIIWESMESWPIGTRVDGQEITPTLNAVLEKEASSVFYNPYVFSQVGPGHTIDGQLLTLSGMHPTQNVVYAIDYAESHYHTLASAMREQRGTRNYLFCPDKFTLWNIGRVAVSFGIDSLLLRPCWDFSQNNTGKKLADKLFFKQSVEKLKAGVIWPERENAYLQFNTSSSHSPFRIPEEEKVLHISSKLPTILVDYLHAVNYTDRMLAHLLDYLRSRSDWDKTMVVIVGDHEGLASWRGDILRDKTAQEFVCPQTFVPFIAINVPECFVGRTDKVMGQVDVYSSVRQMLGLDGQGWPGLGVSVFQPSAPGFAVNYEGKIVGDTVGVDAALIQHVDRARHISNLMIQFDLTARPEFASPACP